MREDKNENEMVERKAEKSEFQFVGDTEDPLPHAFERFVQPLPPSGHEKNIYNVSKTVRTTNCEDLKHISIQKSKLKLPNLQKKNKHAANEVALLPLILMDLDKFREDMNKSGTRLIYRRNSKKCDNIGC